MTQAIKGVPVGKSAGKSTVKRRYSDGGAILAFALLLLVCYLGGYIFSLINRERISETTVMFGSIEPVRVFQGVIVRNETVYYSNAAGMVIYRKQDGDRLHAGAVAASVQDAAVVQRIWDSILLLQENILEHHENRMLSAAVENEINGLMAQLVRSVDNLSLSISALDMQSLYGLTHRAEQLIYNRNNIIYNETQGIPRITNELGLQFWQLDRAVSQTTARNSGIISYRTDGFEYRFTPANVRVLSKEETFTNPNYNEISTPGYVNPGDPIFKIVNSNEWFIAAYLPLDQVADWRQNETRSIFVDDGKGNFNELQCSVHFIEINGLAGEAYVVLSVNRAMTDFLNQRGISFKIKRGLTEGLKIPNSAISDKVIYKIPVECVMERGGLRHVLRFNPHTNGFEEVTLVVFSSEPGFLHIIAEYNSIKIGDVLSVPDTFNETRLVSQSEDIKGVYVTNTGVAVFRRIHLSNAHAGDMFGNIHYTILDPAINNGIRVQDRIATDASGVRENQFVY
jgi:hypothetical protein